MSVQMAVETNGTKAVPVEIGDAGEPRLKLRLCAEWVVVVESPNGTAP